MSDDQYKMLCKRAHEEFEAEVQQAKVRLDAKLRAIALVRNLAEPNPTPRTTTSSAREGSTLHQMVREAVQVMEGPITLQTVVAWVEAGNPDLDRPIILKSISTSLRRLAEDGVLETVIPGSGRRPTTYRKRTT